MAAQNIYDDPDFLAGYSTLDRQVHGLDGVVEWPVGWPLNNYLVEGERVTNWFVDGSVKEHRTVATYVNGVIDAGFVLDRIVEWGPTAEEVQTRPELDDDRHRPWFLLVRATRTTS